MDLCQNLVDYIMGLNVKTCLGRWSLACDDASMDFSVPLRCCNICIDIYNIIFMKGRNEHVTNFLENG